MIKTTIIMRGLMLNGVLFFMLLGLFWFSFLKLNQSSAVNTLYDYKMGDEIHTILIVSPQHKIKLEKMTAQWVMTYPIKVAIDERKVRHLMTLLSEPIVASYAIEGKKLARFGLNNKPLSIAFNGVKIEFGTLNPISHQRYLRKDDRVYMVAETIHGLLVGGVDGFLAP